MEVGVLVANVQHEVTDVGPEGPVAGGGGGDRVGRGVGSGDSSEAVREDGDGRDVGLLDVASDLNESVVDGSEFGGVAGRKAAK